MGGTRAAREIGRCGGFRRDVCGRELAASVGEDVGAQGVCGQWTAGAGGEALECRYCLRPFFEARPEHMRPLARNVQSATVILPGRQITHSTRLCPALRPTRSALSMAVYARGPQRSRYARPRDSYGVALGVAVSVLPCKGLRSGIRAARRLAGAPRRRLLARSQAGCA